MKRISYKTRRLEIRPYKIQDYKSWFVAYTEMLPKQHKYDEGPYFPEKCSREVFKQIVVRHRDLDKNDKTYIWGVFEKKSGKQVGAIDIHVISREDLQKANLGYRIFNNFWKNGYAGEAVKKVMKASLLDLKLNRLEAVIDVDNLPSIKLVESLKLRHEGIRENYYYQENNWADQVIYIADRKLLKLPALRL